VNGFYPGVLAGFDGLGLTGLDAYRVPILELCKISLVKGLKRHFSFSGCKISRF
jgi:hypothetical protein